MKRSIWGIGIVTLISCVAAACSPASPADMVAEEERHSAEIFMESGDNAGEAGEMTEDNLAEPADSEAEEAVIDQALWKASLDQAIAEAIWDHLDVKETYPESFCCEDHYILDIRDSEGESLEGFTGQKQGLTVYAVDMIQVCKPTENDINEQSHIWFPMALTFSVESDGQAVSAGEPRWILEEFWKSDGSMLDMNREGEDEDAFVGEVREVFPSELAERVFGECYWQSSRNRHKQGLYEQTIQYAGIDGESVVRDLLEGAFVSMEEDDLIATLEHHKYRFALMQYRFSTWIKLVWYGDYTRQFIFSKFLEGEQEEPYGLWMMDILYETNHEIMPYDFKSTGQEFFERYLAEAQELESAYGMEWMKENEPYKWELLTMLQEIEQ